MTAKDRLRKLEYPILFSFLGLWLFIYVLSRLFLEMSTDQTPGWVWIWLMIIFLPPSGYAALRLAYSEGGKWYHSIGYWVMFSIGSMFAGHYILLNGDILVSALIKTPFTTEAKVISVEKVIRRKLGFDHTKVTLEFNGSKIALEARPYSYFYLQDKSTLQIIAGTSFLGNHYVTSTGVAAQEKASARWLYLEDWAYRHRWLGVFILSMIAGVAIKFKFFPDKPGAKPKPIGFWKIMTLTMGILMAIAVVLYAALLIYFKFFMTRN